MIQYEYLMKVKKIMKKLVNSKIVLMSKNGFGSSIFSCMATNFNFTITSKVE